MRRLAKSLWMYFLFATGTLWWTKRRLCAQGATVVLTFHRVLDDEEYARTSSLPGIVVRRETFAALARYISRHCTPVSLSGRDAAKVHGRVPVAVTFDDGWRDNHVHAFPVANQYRIPLTIFVCPGLESRPFPFWPELAVLWWREAHSTGGSFPAQYGTAEQFIEHLKTLPPAERDRILVESATRTPGNEPNNATLSWDEMTSLSRQGVLFGSHTCTHQILVQIDGTEVRRELTESREILERRLGAPCRTLAYPNGDCSPRVRELAAEAGYQLAFTTRPGVWSRNCDPLLIPRINIWEGKIVGRRGRFSRVAFEYSVFWKAALAGSTAPASRPESAPSASSDKPGSAAPAISSKG
jgi:peptidoglycan/xylan/chitin deacetylase (PgdA/CDA1 family)